jgi:PAS domain S-box-containing protein
MSPLEEHASHGVDQNQAENERSRFFTLSPHLLCIGGFDGYFKHLNSIWQQTLGYTNEELLSQPYMAFVHPDDQESTFDETRKLPYGHVVQAFENRYRCKDGSYRWLTWNAIPLIDQQLIYATARDITEEKRTDRRRAAQYAIARVLAESVTLAEAAPKLLQAVCESVDWQLGVFWNVEKHANLLRCVDIWAAPLFTPEEFSAVTKVMTFPSGIGLPGRVWESRKPSWIHDILLDTNFPRLSVASSSGLHGAFAFPILLAEEVTGVMEFFSRDVRPPDEDLLKMMYSLGSQIGQSIGHKRAEEEKEKLILELQEALANVKTLSGLLPICATCKNVRDDKGYWRRIEDYIGARSHAEFTHGICTDCARKVHPDWDES